MHTSCLSNKLILTLIGCFLFVWLPFTTQAAKLFTDVPTSHPHFEAVSELEKRGILNGYPDGTFQPNVAISRAGALKVVLLTGGVEVTGIANTKPFPDVPLAAWYAQIVNKGVKLSIVKGDDKGNFVPERTVSRSEALAMLFRIQGTNPAVPASAPFADVPLFAWYANYFQAAKELGLITGATADPEHQLSRAELSDLAYRFFKDTWTPNSEMTGKASYYGSGMEGGNTASGEKLINSEFLAAHRTLSFGTRVRVTNTDNLKSVVVKIVDRGPYVEGRVIDLTQAAFARIAPLSQGIAPVSLEIVSETETLGQSQNCVVTQENGSIEADAFPGIKLSSSLPTRFRVNEVVMINGEITDGSAAEDVTAFYGVEDNKVRAYASVKGNKFQIPLFMEKVGSFNLGMFPGRSGKTPTKKISVIEPSCEAVFAESTSAGPQNLRASLMSGQAIFFWDDPANNLFRIEFTQDDQRAVFYVRNSTSFSPPFAPFQQFSEGKTDVRIWGAKTSGDTPSRSSNWTAGKQMSVFATKHVSRTNNKLTDVSLTEEFSPGQRITISGSTDRQLQDEIVIIEPGDTIVEAPLTRNGNSFSGSFTATKSGTHIVEILQGDALALFVGATVPKGMLPLLPDYFDLEDAGVVKPELVASENRPAAMLALVNQERTQRNLSPLTLDATLGRLADFRANDMCSKNYFGHVDLNGRSASDYRVVYGVETGISENIAKHGDIVGAHEGLMRSPIHRKLILDAENSRVGFGFCESRDEGDTNMVVVQIFGGEPFVTSKIPTYREAILAEVNAVRTSKPILPNTTLQSVAQKWAELMAEHEFWGFEYGGESLEKMLREADIANHTRSFVFKVGSVSELSGAFRISPIAIGSNSQENFLLDTAYGKMGAGFAHSDSWDVYLVVIAIK